MVDNLVLEGHLRTVIEYLILFVEACGAFVITVGVIRTIVQYVHSHLTSDETEIPTLRLRLGQSMVMGLEFQVAADILKTAVTPTWMDILQLGALIALRTLLNWLLERELEHLDEVCEGIAQFSLETPG